jgi:hypothetical protein
MIDVVHEELFRLAMAGRILNPHHPPHVATVHRWAGNGVRGVKLEVIRVGGQRFTSREAVARFLAALNSSAAVPVPPNRAAEIAGKKLAEMGC